MTWANWAGDQVCSPRTIERPGSVDELAAVITGAEHDTIRVVGAGHSFGDLVCTSGTIISLDRLSGLIDYDEHTGLATVAAGTRLYVLNRLIAQRGRAMANLGDVNVQSVAGAISTATHGTGITLGNMATQVEALDLVLADGTVRTISAGDELRAARVSIGALGVMASVTLRTVPAFRLHGVDESRNLDEVLLQLDEIVDGNDHFEFFAFPHSKDALTRTNNRTDEPPHARGTVGRYVNERVLENRVVDLVCRTGRRFPRWIPRLNRLITGAASRYDRVLPSDEIFSSVRDIRFTESEWAVPREAGADLVREVFAMIERRGFAVNLPLEVRFVAADEQSWLSPAWGRDTCYVAVHMYRGMPWQPYFEAVQEIALAHEGRPHWGKRHMLDAAALAPRYPMWDRFQAVRRDLDPGGRFANEHIRRIMG